MTDSKIKTTASAICVAPRKWVAVLRTNEEINHVSGLEWNTRDQAKNESEAWLIMLKRSGRA